MAAAFYLLLSGAEVATQRSFIMIAIVLVGVMLDRPALTFRTLAVAAVGVLLLAPQAAIHPSFQMSFAATLALVAAYQYGLPWRANADSSLAIRVALWAIATPQPDILIAGDGQSAAVRGSDGRLAVLYSGRDTFAVKEWLAADADTRTPVDPSLADGIACDAIGCIGKLGNGRLASMVLGVEAFAEDCRRADVVISPREASFSSCPATLIDREVWRSRGAVALRWTGDHFEQSVARPLGYERPWTVARPLHAGTTAQAATAAQSGDATPRAEDLGVED